SRTRRDETFDTHLERFAASLADAWEHRECSMGRIVRALGLKRDPAVVPLVQVILNIDRRIEPPAFAGIKASFEGTPRAFENFEMFLTAIHDSDGMLLECTYDAALSEARSIERRFQELEHFIATLCETPAPLGTLPLLDATDRALLDDLTRGPV